MMAENPYAVLGLEPGATAGDVRRAYFRLVKVNTPEAHPEAFKRIRAAYETLRSPLRRVELELLSFDESAAEVDLNLIPGTDGVQDFDAAALLLAVEWSASDLTRAAFPEDLTAIQEEDLLGRAGSEEAGD